MPDEGAGHICGRCGVRSVDPHVDTDECIDALRDKIARMQFQQEKRVCKTSDSTRRGGRRPRRDNRFVLLDGERLVLAEAARMLGLSTSALHWRLVGRCGKDYHDPDVRGVHADVSAEREPRVLSCPGGSRVPREHIQNSF